MIRFSMLAPHGAALALLALAACEGEPPKVPLASATPSVTPPAASDSAALEAAPTPAPTAPAAAVTPCCKCGPESPTGAAAAGPSAAAPATPLSAGTPAPASAEAAPAAAAHPNITGHVSTTPAQAAALAVVFLEDAPLVPGRGDYASIDNQKMAFIPFVQVVTAGGKIGFTNTDPFPHNVFSPDNGRFDLGSIGPHATTVHVFKKAGEYSLLCNLHPNMLGYVVVSPSSYFAKTNKKGEFTIKDVPPGTYKVTAWAPRQQTVTQAIVVKDTDATLDFALHR